MVFQLWPRYAKFATAGAGAAIRDPNAPEMDQVPLDSSDEEDNSDDDSDEDIVVRIGGQAIGANSDSDGEENGPGGGSGGEEDEEGEEDDDEEGDRTLAEVFMGVVRGMALSEHEAVALRLCIARDDPLVRAALEVFKLERDEDDLRDTLKRLARRTVDATLRQVQAEGGAAPN